MKDDQLISAYLEGDESALSVLVDRYLTDVYGFALKLTNDPQAAEDITQESFIKAWKNIRRFLPGSSFQAWVFTIVRNTALDYLRKKKEFPLSDAHAALLVDEELLPDELFARAENQRYVQGLLAELNPNYREVLTLRYSSNLTFEKIGELLKKPLHTVKSQHRRALVALARVHQNNSATRI